MLNKCFSFKLGTFQFLIHEVHATRMVIALHLRIRTENLAPRETVQACSQPYPGKLLEQFFFSAVRITFNYVGLLFNHSNFLPGSLQSQTLEGWRVGEPALACTCQAIVSSCWSPGTLLLALLAHIHLQARHEL